MHGATACACHDSLLAVDLERKKEKSRSAFYNRLKDQRLKFTIKTANPLQALHRVIQLPMSPTSKSVTYTRANGNGCQLDEAKARGVEHSRLGSDVIRFNPEISIVRISIS